MLLNEYKKAVKEIEISNYSALLNIGRKWNKIEDKKTNLQIAILGSASIQLITSVTRALLTKYDICADIYEGEYNGVFIDTMDETSELYRFEPEYIIILPDYHDIIEWKPSVLANRETVERAVEYTVGSYLSIFEKVHSKLPQSQILFSNFVSPYGGEFGQS